MAGCLQKLCDPISSAFFGFKVLTLSETHSNVVLVVLIVEDSAADAFHFVVKVFKYFDGFHCAFPFVVWLLRFDELIIYRLINTGKLFIYYLVNKNTSIPTLCILV